MIYWKITGRNLFISNGNDITTFFVWRNYISTTLGKKLWWPHTSVIIFSLGQWKYHFSHQKDVEVPYLSKSSSYLEWKAIYIMIIILHIYFHILYNLIFYLSFFQTFKEIFKPKRRFHKLMRFEFKHKNTSKKKALFDLIWPLRSYIF